MLVVEADDRGICSRHLLPDTGTPITLPDIDGLETGPILTAENVAKSPRRSIVTGGSCLTVTQDARIRSLVASSKRDANADQSD